MAHGVNRNAALLHSKWFNHLPNANVKGKYKGKRSRNMPLCCLHNDYTCDSSLMWMTLSCFKPNIILLLHEKHSYNLKVAADWKGKIKRKYVPKNNNESTTNLFHMPGHACRFLPLSEESLATDLCQHAHSRNAQWRTPVPPRDNIIISSVSISRPRKLPHLNYVLTDHFSGLH